MKRFNKKSGPCLIPVEVAVRLLGIGRFRMLERAFHRARGYGPMSEEVFQKVIFGELFPNFPNPISSRLFNVFDVNHCGELTAQQFVTAIALITKGSLEEQINVLCLFYDRLGVGLIFKEDIYYYLQKIDDGNGLRGGGMDFRAARSAVDDLFLQKGKTSLTRERAGKKIPSGLNGLVTKDHITYEDFSSWAIPNLHNPLCLWLSVVQLAFDRLKFDDDFGKEPNENLVRAGLPTESMMSTMSPMFNGWGRDLDMQEHDVDPVNELPFSVSFADMLGLRSSMEYFTSKILSIMDIKTVTSLWQISFSSANELNVLYHAIQSVIRWNQGSHLVDLEMIEYGVVGRLSTGIPRPLLERIFQALQSPISPSGCIDIFHFGIGLGWYCSQNVEYCLELCFHLYDTDNDQLLTPEEVRAVLAESYWTVQALSITSRLPSIPSLRRKLSNSYSRASIARQAFLKGGDFGDSLQPRMGSPHLSDPSSSSSPSVQSPKTCDFPYCFLDKELLPRIDALIQKIEKFSVIQWPSRPAKDDRNTDPHLIGLKAYKRWLREESEASTLLREIQDLTAKDLFERPASFREESAIIKSIWEPFNPQQPGSPGTEWCLLSSRWWNDFCEAVGLPRIDLETQDAVVMHERESKAMFESADTSQLFDTSAGEVKLTKDKNIGLSPIDNSNLLVLGSTSKLRANLHFLYDYILVSYRVWTVLKHWYGASIELCRSVVDFGDGRYQLELYPITVHFYLDKGADKSDTSTPIASREYSRTLKVGELEQRAIELLYSKNVGQNVVAAEVIGKSCIPGAAQGPRKLVRLWISSDDDPCWQPLKAEDPEASLGSLQLVDGHKVLIECRDSNGEFPRDSLASDRVISRHVREKRLSGLVGLYNLGNTCYLNSAIQCLAHAPLFAEYLTTGEYLFDINPRNPMGSGGALATAYGALISAMWKEDGQPRLAPRNLKEVVSTLNSQFDGLYQQDAQELLSLLLATLSEDLNRVTKKPYTEQKDSGDRDDMTVAEEWWRNHCMREASVVTALFTGQYKSLLTCKTCNFASARFEPFLFLQLSLPEPTTIKVHVDVFPRNKAVVKNAKVAACIPTGHHKMVVEVPIASPTVMEVLGQVAKSPFWTETLGRSSGPSVKDLLAVQLAETYVHNTLSPEKLLPISRHNDKPLGTGSCQANCLSVFELDKQPLIEDVETDDSDSDGFEMTRSPVAVPADSKLTSALPSLYRVGSLVLAEYQGLGSGAEASSAPQRERIMLPAVVTAVNNDRTLALEFDTAGTALEAKGELSTQGVDPKRVCRIINPSCATIYIVHRRLQLMPFYFVSPFKPVCFSLPGILRIMTVSLTGEKLYEILADEIESVLSLTDGESSPLAKNALSWKQTKGRISSLSSQHQFKQWGFRVCRVNRNGVGCSSCGWVVGCLGCPIPSDASKILLSDGETVAIDWGTDLIKFYDVEKPIRPANFEVGEAEVFKAKDQLQDCLRSFTMKETLTAMCSSCTKRKGGQDPCTTEQEKVMNLWALPPLLIIQLKRFKFTGTRNFKLDNIVSFPLNDLDLQDFLCPWPMASRNSQQKCERRGYSTDDPAGSKMTEVGVKAEGDGSLPSSIGNCQGAASEQHRENSTSPVFSGDILDDVTKFPLRLLSREHTKYDLFGVVNHSGQIGAGHYTAYAKHSFSDNDKAESAKWYCFDDSKVYEVGEHDIQSSGAYLLFYVRKDMKGKSIQELLPRAHDRPIDLSIIQRPKAASTQKTQSTSAIAKTSNSASQSETNCLVM